MLTTVNTWILRLEYVLGIVALGVTTVSIILEIICRYIFRFPLNWTVELAMFLLSWVTFIGASILLKRQGHIRINLLLESVSPVTMELIEILIESILLIALSIMFINAIEVFHIQNFTRTVTLHIPRGYFVLPLILASVSMFLFTIQSISKRIESLSRLLKK